MAKKTECDRCGRTVRNGGKVYTLKLVIVDQVDPSDEDIVEIEDGCDRCRGVVRNCMTLAKSRARRKKKVKAAKKKDASKAKASPKRKPPKKTRTAAKPAKAGTGTKGNGLFDLPAPIGPPSKPAVPPPPGGAK
jgi:hypothetical protein